VCARKATTDEELDRMRLITLSGRTRDETEPANTQNVTLDRGSNDTTFAAIGLLEWDQTTSGEKKVSH
jgi:hypothetical protein